MIENIAKFVLVFLGSWLGLALLFMPLTASSFEACVEPALQTALIVTILVAAAHARNRINASSR